MAKQTEQVPVILDLTEGQIAKLNRASNGNGDRAENLGKLASRVLALAADGAAVIGSRDVRRLSDIAGEPLNDPKKLIALVEKALGRKGSNLLVTCKVDVTHEGFLKELARVTGRSIEKYLQDNFNLFLIDQSYRDYAGDVRPVFFSGAQYQRLRSLISGGELEAKTILAALEGQPEPVAADTIAGSAEPTPRPGGKAYAGVAAVKED